MIESIKERRSDCSSAFNTSIDKLVTHAYNVIDLDRNGKLSPWEHATYMKTRGVSRKDALKSYAAVDSNHDGDIELDEFVSCAISYFNTNDESCPSNLFFGPIV